MWELQKQRKKTGKRPKPTAKAKYSTKLELLITFSIPKPYKTTNAKLPPDVYCFISI
jgi:hypothetical protein